MIGLCSETEDTKRHQKPVVICFVEGSSKSLESFRYKKEIESK